MTANAPFEFAMLRSIRVWLLRCTLLMSRRTVRGRLFAGEHDEVRAKLTEHKASTAAARHETADDAGDERTSEVLVCSAGNESSMGDTRR